jgi:hypothetical protein
VKTRSSAEEHVRRCGTVGRPPIVRGAREGCARLRVHSTARLPLLTSTHTRGRHRSVTSGFRNRSVTHLGHVRKPLRRRRNPCVQSRARLPRLSSTHTMVRKRASLGEKRRSSACTGILHTISRAGRAMLEGRAFTCWGRPPAPSSPLGALNPCNQAGAGLSADPHRIPQQETRRCDPTGAVHVRASLSRAVCLLFDRRWQVPARAIV